MQGKEPVRPADGQEWIQLAQARLRELLSEIESVTALQREAERIRAALAAAEVPKVPELPWLAGRKATGKRTVSWTCQRCGKKLFAGQAKQMVGGPGMECREECTALVTNGTAALVGGPRD